MNVMTVYMQWFITYVRPPPLGIDLQVLLARGFLFLLHLLAPLKMPRAAVVCQQILF